VSAEELDGARVRLEFVPNFDSWEYLVGQVEAGNHLRIDVRHAS
jgi:hypothetical protein